MSIELEQAEVRLLSEVLQSRLGEYSEQIASADDSSFREGLRQERDSLRGILEKVQRG